MLVFFGFVLVSFFFEHIMSLHPLVVVVEEETWRMVPRMQWWVALMS